MDDWLVRAAKTALWLEEDISLAKANRLGFTGRRVSKEEKTRIVAECHQPGTCLQTVAHRNRVTRESVRRWVRLAGGPGVAKLAREDAAVQPTFVPVVVDGLASADAVEIEADRVIVRLPADTSPIRMVAVAAYLGRLE